MVEQSLMERFADPTLFDTLTFSEKMAGSLVTTLMGMGVTFTILILLWGIIRAMARMMKTGNQPKKTAGTPVAVAQEVSTSAPVATVATTSDSLSDGQLIAVLMAAIAAEEGAAVASNLVIRKINRIAGGQTAWRSAGSAECLDSRRV